MTAYYNEIDPFCVQWLRNLIDAGHIAPGVVDDRSIKDVQPSDLSGFTQCHFFAGVGVWSYALRSAGWGDGRATWSGSCPCQSFSPAGKRRGFDDERHLWPEWYRLIRERRPPVIFGEQVQSKDSLPWLDLVSADLEASGYAFGALGACAAGVGAPHKRSRLYFVADTHQGGCEGGEVRLRERGPREGVLQLVRGGGLRDMADSEAPERRRAGEEGHSGWWAAEAGGPSHDGRVEDGRRPGKANGFWRDADWIFCRDGKWRAARPGTQPLADGVAGRVGRLRAYGNAIVAPLAAEFVRAYMECRP